MLVHGKVTLQPIHQVSRDSYLIDSRFELREMGLACKKNEFNAHVLIFFKESFRYRWETGKRDWRPSFGRQVCCFINMILNSVLIPVENIWEVGRVRLTYFQKHCIFETITCPKWLTVKMIIVIEIFIQDNPSIQSTITYGVPLINNSN